MSDKEKKDENWFTQLGTHIQNTIKSFVPENILRDQQVLSAFDHMDEIINAKIKDVKHHPELEWEATVRKSNELCDDEKKFVQDRKNYIREAFAKYIGVDVSEVHPDDIPTIAFMGSGGGFRAMIVVTAYFAAMKDSGLYDCGTYVSGLSGSCWNLAQLYTSLTRSNPENHPLDNLLNYYKANLTHSITNVRGVFKDLAHNANPKTAVELCFGGLHEKKIADVSVDIMDLFGALLATKIMLGPDPSKQYDDFKLSRQRKYIDGGKDLLPIHVCTYHVRPWKDALDAKDAELVENYAQVWEEYKKLDDHYQWYEVTPYEFGTEEIPAYIPTWAFGRKFEGGKDVTRVPEQNLGLMIGLFGSAPSAPLLFEINQLELALGNGWAKKEFKRVYDKAIDKMGEEKQRVFEGHQPVPPPTNNNFTYRLEPPPYKLGVTNSPYIKLMDGGVSNDSPVYPMSRPARKIEIVIGFDCSSVIVGRELFEKEQKEFCEIRGLDRNPRDTTNKFCEIHDYTPNGKTNGYCPPAEHPFTLCYFPYLPNDKVDPKFIPATEKFMAFNNFTYTSEQVDKTVQLAKQNWADGQQKVKEVIIEVWKKKKAARLGGK
ncbi:FabD/lysophospholipase-like protein [Gigaspora margarita]|uniref:Lysophospholipase n=1 Tax=Gigaspora margarita TaxID=4874 RepID=A0A8H4ER73_GIGMA|nr:FabD/lysophospholipase-like protein [Gigaspora margarita]